MYPKMNWTTIKLLGRGSHGVVYLVVLENLIIFMNFIAIKRADIKMSVSLDKELRIFNHLNNCPEIISCFGEQLTDASGVALDI